MNEWPLPNSVLVIDNASIHKVTGIREMVEERGAHLLYLPAYSPDFNPIELAFSTIKTWLRTNRDRVNCEPRTGGWGWHSIQRILGGGLFGHGRAREGVV